MSNYQHSSGVHSKLFDIHVGLHAHRRTHSMHTVLCEAAVYTVDTRYSHIVRRMLMYILRLNTHMCMHVSI
jgi:hypothetical protein